ncbi:serine protease inhibitor 42Dd [Scaptodrosophila lebanonensis]|uniref:Serine protease inhibitor 42Dd n=1 Tax=Drosophila lebanonensis TaxID=7225 RepID=A0A6J2UM66_DROLE|nr:serine protease inhibitor 42Dd [Scaptodrosophila lebanonensis]
MDSWCSYSLLIFSALCKFIDSVDQNVADEPLPRDELYYALASEYANENVIFSSEMVRAALFFIYIGIEGEGSDEMRLALAYHGVTMSDFQVDSAKIFNYKWKDAPIAHSVIRYFIRQDHKIARNYKMYMRHMMGKAVNVDFSEDQLKATNKELADELGPIGADVIAPAVWGADHLALLVNAMYFNMSWHRTFNTQASYPRIFHVNESRKLLIKMMHEDSTYLWGELKELNATAVVLPFAFPKLKMLLIKPNHMAGLDQLEYSLAGTDINALVDDLVQHDVFVALPKFKIRCDMEVTKVIRRLGIGKIFEISETFTTLLNKSTPFRVTGIRHVNTFEFTEAGVGVAPTPMGYGSLARLFRGVKYFLADHPFAFFIIDKKSVFLSGHITNF